MFQSEELTVLHKLCSVKLLLYESQFTVYKVHLMYIQQLTYWCLHLASSVEYTVKVVCLIFYTFKILL